MGLFVLLGRLIGRIFRFLRAVFPYIMKVAVFVAKAMAVTLAATFRGWGPVARQISEECTDEILKRLLLPVAYQKVLYYIFLAIAYFTLLVGWIFLSYLTVFLVRLKFGR